MAILVVGATGQTGQQIVAKLRERDERPRILVRSRDRAVERFGSDLEIATGDVLQPASLGPALAGITTVFCATGARPGFGGNSPQQVDYEGTLNLVRECRRAGVRRFVLVSSLCVSKLFHPLNLFGLVLYWKKKAEDFVIDSGLDFTIVRPGGLRTGAGGAEIVIKPADTLFEGSIDRADVARVCVEAASTPEASFKIVEIVSGPGPAQASLTSQFAALPAVSTRVAAS